MTQLLKFFPPGQGGREGQQGRHQGGQEGRRRDSVSLDSPGEILPNTLLSIPFSPELLANAEALKANLKELKQAIKEAKKAAKKAGAAPEVEESLEEAEVEAEEAVVEAEAEE